MHIPPTRKEALATGAEYYFTGKPCKRGHIALRKPKGSCIECLADDMKKQNDRRKGMPKSDASREAGRRYYLRNKERVKERASGRPREQQREYKRRWKSKNKEAVRLYTNLRRRRYRQATPPWLTDDDKLEIKAMYARAAQLTKETGMRYTVDHIIPLNGERVCGLHVPWNLQTLRHSANAKKGNRT